MSRRYALERLGWPQLERACGELLERGCGIPRDAWRGRLDEGRTARLEGDVRLPGGARLIGPVAVVIVAGDGWPARALTALMAGGTSRRALLVIDPIGPGGTDVAAVTELVGAERPSRVAVIGPAELDAMIDALPAVRRVLPSLLGVCDVRALIGAEQAGRSSFDIDAAARLARVFVPTDAHARALEVLDEHGFCLLTGPPEMGKTATARMVALSALSDGWEAYECMRPAELWSAFDERRRQVFIADDAFGSTEYHPEAAGRWALELDRVLRAMDDRHHLIWTSRPGPLRAGLGRVRREHGVERFPRASAVTVSAAAMSIEEKAQMLLRHARAAGLSDLGRRAVMDSGWAIVSNPHLTPERIRRFVSGRLAFTGWLALHPDRLERAVAAEIREPTVGMTQSLRALSRDEWMLLVALLDVPPGPVGERDLVATIRRHLGGGLGTAPQVLVDQLTDHFLRVSDTGAVTWIHPSWRDLVIDTLSDDPAARRRFLERCGVDGALLAVSVAGGAAGDRMLPLLRGSEDGDPLAGRMAALARDEEDMASVLDGLRIACAAEGLALAQRVEVHALARGVLEEVRARWDTAREPIGIEPLALWLALGSLLEPRPQAPVLGPTWVELLPTASLDLGAPEEAERLEEWTLLIRALRRYDPALLGEFDFPRAHRKVLGELARRAVRHGAGSYLGRVRIAEALRALAKMEPALDSRDVERLVRESPMPPAPSLPGLPPPPPLPEEMRTVERILADLGPVPAIPSGMGWE